MTILTSNILAIIQSVLYFAVIVYFVVWKVRRWRARRSSSGTMLPIAPPFFWLLMGVANLVSLMRTLGEDISRGKLLQLVLLMQAIAAVLFFFEAWRQLRALPNDRSS